ncbi:MAG TPA: PH domain-containing protein, partial [Solirubrobacteraceae bacterium]|nr:PH domain-containing protein [Solirubrobacteraceae bacterium]
MSSEPRRLHPAELAFGALDALRELLFPVLLGVVIGSGSGSGRGLLIGVAGLAAGGSLALVRWWRTTYAVTPADVHFRSGIASPDETVVPIARIAAVDVVQGPLQRLLGVVELQVQVAGGGGEPEIRLRAVARDDALALRAALGHPAAPPAPPLWRLSRRRLLVAALTAPQLGLLVPVLALAGAVGQQLVEAGEGPRLADRLPGTAGGAALAAAALLAAAWALSVAGAVVAFAGFELRVEGDRLRIRRGLLQRRAASVPLDRVHAVRLLESPVRQPFGLVAVRLETAGYRSQARATQTLLPVAGHDEARAVLARVLAVPPAATALRAVPARARRRYALWPALG